MIDTAGSREDSFSPRQSVATLCLVMKPGRLPQLYPLLQHGFVVQHASHCSIRALLCERMSVSSAYVENNIQTIFLNGKVVDDIDSALPEGRSTLALSAAMPGLVGAALRRKTALGKFRSGITLSRADSEAQSGPGISAVKLFNLVARDLGPILFAAGLTFDTEALDTFFSSAGRNVLSFCRKAELDGRTIPIEALTSSPWAGAVYVSLKVCSPSHRAPVAP